jgi:fatty acid desaturase
MGYDMLIVYSVILLALQAALIIIIHCRLLPVEARITRLTLVKHRAATTTVAMGVAALLALGLVLHGIAPRWLLAGVGMAWICQVQATILDIVLHLLDAERELTAGRRRDMGRAPTGIRGEGGQHQRDVVDC